jgi:hypothetical protein
MSKSKYKLLNWSNYNLSLINRGNITFWIDENIARHWYSDKDPNKRGKQYVYIRSCHV